MDLILLWPYAKKAHVLSLFALTGFVPQMYHLFLFSLVEAWYAKGDQTIYELNTFESIGNPVQSAHGLTCE